MLKKLNLIFLLFALDLSNFNMTSTLVRSKPWFKFRFEFDSLFKGFKGDIIIVITAPNKTAAGRFIKVVLDRAESLERGNIDVNRMETHWQDSSINVDSHFIFNSNKRTLIPSLNGSGLDVQYECLLNECLRELTLCDVSECLTRVYTFTCM
jgi:hypothetical protein